MTWKLNNFFWKIVTDINHSELIVWAKYALNIIAKKICKYINSLIESYDCDKLLNDLSFNYISYNLVKGGDEDIDGLIATTAKEVEADELQTGIVYKEIPMNSATLEKLKPWAYYVTDSDIMRYIQDCNLNGKWNIDTFVLRELQRYFKAAKIVLYHTTEEDAVKTKEKFISSLEAILEKKSLLKRLFLLLNSNTLYKEGIADSKLSQSHNRLKVFMEALLDPQHMESILKEFIINVKKNRKNIFSSSLIDQESLIMMREAHSTEDIFTRKKHRIN